MIISVAPRDDIIAFFKACASTVQRKSFVVLVAFEGETKDTIQPTFGAMVLGLQETRKISRLPNLSCKLKTDNFARSRREPMKAAATRNGEAKIKAGPSMSLRSTVTVNWGTRRAGERTHAI